MRPTAPGLALALLLLAGCASQRDPADYLSYQSLDTTPAPDDFTVCASAGCRKTSRLAYSDSEWDSIAAVFDPPPATAAEERDRIAVAVAAMETYIGAKNGTHADRPMNRRNGLHQGQLDCIAEAANTTVALTLLHREGLLRHHRVGFPAHRGFAQLRLPHNTATVYELDGGERYAVDSWFFANGEKPVCVPVAAWTAGYSPFKDNPFHPARPQPE
ncbi:MAG: hypothetical protein ACLFVC_00855 [Opitutales bacterium]